MRLLNRNIYKYKMKLSRFKANIWEEYIPLLFIALSYSVPFSYLYLPPLMICSCFIWKGWIVIWASYYLWIWYDSPTLRTKGRKMKILKHLLAFDCVRRYFPIRLVKTVNLPPDKNYLLACYPHGIIPHGMMGNFLTNFTKATKLYPGLDMHVATLEVLFKLPLVREYLMALGSCVAGDEHIKYWLNSKPSKAVILLPGGIKELLLSRPGKKYKIVTRKGFIRIALQTGASLVPVFTFGEHNTQDQEEYKSGVISFIINLLFKYTRLKINRIIGRGIFQKHFGLLPHRRPLTTVVGKPIPVPKVEDPSSSLIDEYREKYFNALYDLFESNKHIYDEASSSAKLIMV